MASLFAPVWRTAGSRLSVCGEHLFHCAGGAATSAAGDIMCRSATGMSDGDEYNV